MKRILFFVHYNKYNSLAEYVVYLLEHIKHIYNKIVFISNSSISDTDQIKLESLCDEIIRRDNTGFDFGVWRDALLREGWDKLSEYDNVTLMNDSCFGPLFDLEVSYKKMEQQDIDFWGMTDHSLCFHKKVIESNVFQNFWNMLANEKDIDNLKHIYEKQLTVLLNKKGYKFTTFLNSTNSDNLSLLRPDLCIINSLPFIEIKSFKNFNYPNYLLQLIENKTDYPVSMILNYFTELFDPSTSLPIINKTLTNDFSNSNKANDTPEISIALHLHVYYLNIFKEFVQIFDNLQYKYDLIITTDTIEKQNEIKEYLCGHKTKDRLKEILIFDNIGRDIVPWISISSILTNYDIVGHFHTKKTSDKEEYFASLWLNELFDLLLYPISLIVDTFNNNSKIGIIIPEIPYIFQYPNIRIPLHEKKTRQLMNDLWQEMKCSRQIDFTKLSTLIFPFGTMFWYRPKALKPLFNINLKTLGNISEPLSPNRTSLHSIERILVYIAWNEGFDYRISSHKIPLINSFHYSSAIENLIQNYTSSESYQIGKFLLFVPGLLKRVIKRKINEKY